MKAKFSIPCIEMIQKFIPGFNPDEPMFDLELSFEDPPLLEQKPENKWEVYGIDGLLGLYIAEKKLIKIYIKGIEYVNNHLGIPSTHLYIIILMHEIGHYYCHEVDIEGTRWETNRFNGAKSCVHEYLAQLFTYYALKDNEDLLDSFIKLDQTQSIEYQRYNGSKDLPFNLFNKLIKHLRLVSGMVDIYSIGDILFQEYFDPIVIIDCSRYDDFRDFIRENLQKKWNYLGVQFGFYNKNPRFDFKNNILSCTSTTADCLCKSMIPPFDESILLDSI